MIKMFHILTRLLLIGALLWAVIGVQASVAAQPTSDCRITTALWATSRSSDNGLDISGSNTTLASTDTLLRSNSAIVLSGSNNFLSGSLIYADRFEDGGDANRYPPAQQRSAVDPPPAYAIADYRPAGASAAAALAAGRYTLVNGDLDLAEPQVLDGLYYVTGDAKLSASDLIGNATIVAEGTIDVSGSLHNLTPYINDLLFFSAKAEVDAAVIKLAGSNSALRGAIYGPGGMIELSGSSNGINGIILADTLKLSGSDLNVRFDGTYCPPSTPTHSPRMPPSFADAYVPGELVIKLFQASDLEAVAQQYNLDPSTSEQFGARPIFRLAISDATDPPSKAATLRNDPRVEYVEPNYLTQDPESRGSRGSWVIGEQSADTYAAQWAPELIGLPTAFQRSTGAGITLAVLDTGVDRNHPALRDRLTAGFDFVDFDDDPSEVGNRAEHAGFGHGTHVAGLAALAAPDALIMPVRVLDPNGVGNVWVLAEALLYTVERGPDGILLNGDEPQVINLSLGTQRRTDLLDDLLAEITCADDDDDDDDDDDKDSDDTELGAIIDRCSTSSGVIVIVAAGNSGDTTPQYPAAEDVAGALAIGATTRSDQAADFSTYGGWVRLGAPGAEIVGPVPGGAYAIWSGSSMAAPLTAGVAALIRSAEPQLSAVAVSERLISSAKPISGVISLRLNAAQALGLTPPENQIYTVFLPALGKPTPFSQASASRNQLIAALPPRSAAE